MKSLVKIYQCNDSYKACFRNLEMNMRAKTNFFLNYTEAFSGELEFENLDDLYSQFNRDNRPNGKTMRSMSVSDIIWTEQLGLVFVDSIGFSPIMIDEYGRIQQIMSAYH